MAEARPRGEAWTQEETIELWADERVEEQLENTPRRNIEIFKRICEDIKDRIPEERLNICERKKKEKIKHCTRNSNAANSPMILSLNISGGNKCGKFPFSVYNLQK